MFEFWKDLFRPIRIEDPRFGTLRYLRDARMWEGELRFAPLDREVEVVIFGEASGPTDGQRAFYDEVEARYDGLWPTIRERLESAARDYGLDGDQEFRLDGLSIPENPEEAADWDLSYETEPPSRYYFNVLFKGWTPMMVVVDT